MASFLLNCKSYPYIEFNPNTRIRPKYPDPPICPANPDPTEISGSGMSCPRLTTALASHRFPMAPNSRSNLKLLESRWSCAARLDCLWGNGRVEKQDRDIHWRAGEGKRNMRKKCMLPLNITLNRHVVTVPLSLHHIYSLRQLLCSRYLRSEKKRRKGIFIFPKDLFPVIFA